MFLLHTHFRKPTLAEAVLFGAALLAGTVNAAQAVKAGGISGLGMATMAVCGLGWAAWVIRPVLPKPLLPVVLPLLAFVAYFTASMAWTTSPGKGLQLLAVALAFAAVLLLAAREAAADGGFGRRLHVVILVAGGLATAGYAASVALAGHLGGEDLLDARSYALTAMVIAAVALANAVGGDRRAMALAAVMAAALFHSLSRTALVTTLVLVPAAIALRGTARSLVLAAVLLAASGAAFGAALVAYPPLYERFFGHDASLAVGGVNINAEGRTRVWTMLLGDVGDDWMTGKGIASSEEAVESKFARNGLAQPHNDYIRFYYDGGAIALGLWAAFAVAVAGRAAGDLREAIRSGNGDAPLHAAAVLAVGAVLASMATDNPFSYAFVMLPLGLIVGASLGAGVGARVRAADPAAEIAGPLWA